jgi:hypothetical protein
VLQIESVLGKKLDSIYEGNASALRVLSVVGPEGFHLLDRALHVYSEAGRVYAFRDVCKVSFGVQPSNLVSEPALQPALQKCNVASTVPQEDCNQQAVGRGMDCMLQSARLCARWMSDVGNVCLTWTVPAWVPAQSDASNEQKLQQLGELLNASHTSCSRLYQCSCEELDMLVGVARTAGALGARLTGAAAAASASSACTGLLFFQAELPGCPEFLMPTCLPSSGL